MPYHNNKLEGSQVIQLILDTKSNQLGFIANNIPLGMIEHPNLKEGPFHVCVGLNNVNDSVALFH